MTRLYGNKRIWVTEYGYQTNPPDQIFGVSPALAGALPDGCVRDHEANPRIDMMLWFLLRDERRAFLQEGWQSGLLRDRRRKPAFAAFQQLG